MTRARWLPRPFASLALAALWLALNGSLAPGHLAIAVAVGLGLPLLLAAVWPASRGFRRPLRAAALSLGLLAVFLWDVVVANLQVARAVLSPTGRLSPGFVTVPVELEDPTAVVLLALTITLTPGTLTVDVAPDRRSLVVHGLDVPDPDAAVRTIKERYERRLREIFAC